MNRVMLRTLVIANKWLDRCAVWLCTGGWELREIERRMNNLTDTRENVTKGM